VSAPEMIVSLLLGYLCGTIPFGLLLTRAAGLGDVRKIGSGNIGATNVLRTGNRKIAVVTLLCDALKGTLPVIACNALYGPQAGVLAGLAAFFGHLYPMWLGFKGGKGVATNIGVLFGLFWPLGMVFLLVWLAVAFTFRMSSASALTASLLTPLWAWAFGRSDLLLPTLVLGAAIWFTHRANIRRLLSGTEPKIALSKKA
jgi:acyl phosphate:glycerol-3-phosphate acyltransferase